MGLSSFVKQRGNRRDPRLLALFQSLETHAARLRARDLATVLVACRRLAKPPVSLVAAVCAACSARAQEFESRYIANTLNALSQMNCYDAALVSRLSQAALSKADDFNAQGIANTLNALAKFGHDDAAVVSRLSQAALSKADDFSAQDIANSLWTLLALSDSPDLACVTALWARVPGEDTPLWSHEELGQLHLAQLCLAIEHPDWNLVLPADLASATRRAWRASLSAAQSSRFHKRVSRCLTALGVGHENEVEAGRLSVDIVVRDASGVGGLVVEVDGPAHYCVPLPNPPQQAKVLGQYVFKDRLLAKQGWRVLHVPFFEWDPLVDEAQRESYLRTKLNSGESQ